MTVGSALAITLALAVLPGAASGICKRPDGTYTNNCTPRDTAVTGAPIAVTDGQNQESAEFHAKVQPVANEIAKAIANAEASGKVTPAMLRTVLNDRIGKILPHGQIHVSFSSVYPSSLDLAHIDWDVEIWAPKIYDQCYVDVAFLNKAGQKLASGIEVVYMNATQDGFAIVRGQETVPDDTRYAIDRSVTSVNCH